MHTQWLHQESAATWTPERLQAFAKIHSACQQPSATLYSTAVQCRSRGYTLTVHRAQSKACQKIIYPMLHTASAVPADETVGGTHLAHNLHRPVALFLEVNWIRPFRRMYHVEYLNSNSGSRRPPGQSQGGASAPESSVREICGSYFRSASARSKYMNNRRTVRTNVEALRRS